MNELLSITNVKRKRVQKCVRQAISTTSIYEHLLTEQKHTWLKVFMYRAFHNSRRIFQIIAGGNKMSQNIVIMYPNNFPLSTEYQPFCLFT